MPKFQLKAKIQPTPAQQEAIDKLAGQLESGSKDNTLLGVTGCGKTFIMANVIAKLNRPALILCHNKTLAAQNYEEFKDFFPNNAIKYFVSYYDYYQPEAYVPSKDLYIEKEADVNREIERFRLSAMNSAFRRRDTVVIASVSCIYNIGKPGNYENMSEVLKVGDKKNISEILLKLTNLQYERGEYDFYPGTFRMKGDILEIFPPYEDFSYRIEFFGENIERITSMEPMTGQTITEVDEIELFPAKSYVAPPETFKTALEQIKNDLAVRLDELKKAGKLLEAQRLEQRTHYDLEMLEQTGFCAGIENYSRYFDDRKIGEPPYCLLDYYPKDFLTFIDESHMSVPQVGGMSEGDRARKQVLVDYGFRLPAALDNRPLNFNEFNERVQQTIYVSATPAKYELTKSGKNVTELLIRPTGLLDPVVEVRPTKNQIDDVIEEIRKTVAKKQRVLITTLTKRMAEDLSNYLQEIGMKVHYLHSDIDTVERIDILRDLRLGVYDVVIGINLLREGLDLPEVSLVIILDADKLGFLRSETSLIQTIGRAARHVEARAIMYADRISQAMDFAIKETQRRRKIQEEYNQKYGITPTSIKKEIRKAWIKKVDKEELNAQKLKKLPQADLKRNIKMLEEKMYLAARNLDYEEAAELRDQIKLMKQQLSK